MSAEIQLLRQAAALMRERAAASEAHGLDEWWRLAAASWLSKTTGVQSLTDHLASWHPTAARAVADLLEAVDRAARLTGVAAEHPEAKSIRAEALVVARAYLGEEG